jgi:hypothetical protein
MGNDRRAVRASTPQMAVVAVAAAAAPIAMAAGHLVPRDATLLWDLAWTSSALAALGGMLLARRASTGRQRRRFALWAAAAGRVASRGHAAAAAVRA